MKNKTIRALMIFFVLFAMIAFSGRVVAQGMFGGTVAGSSSQRILLIHVEGVISAGPDAMGLFPTGYASSVGICNQLYDALDDPAVKGILLRINSPGGSAAASDEIYQAVLDCREAGKPVVVSMGDVAASGGYYIASAADYIFANGATLTGSIGVVMQLLNWSDLAEEWGIESDTLHAGKYKDIGSPWRDMTPEEDAMLTELLDEVHEQFILAVAAGRTPMSEEQVREVATGMIFNGSKAYELSLVDEIGGMHVAEEKVRQLAGVGSKVPILEEAGMGFWESMFSLKSGQAPSLVQSPLLNEAMLRQVMRSDPLSLLSQSLYLNTLLRDMQMR